MSSSVTDETLSVAAKILGILSRDGCMRVRDLWKAAVRDCAGVEKAQNVLYWLRDRGLVRKCGVEYCSPYEITEKGRAFLSALV